MELEPENIQNLSLRMQGQRNKEFMNVLSLRGKDYIVEEQKVDEFFAGFLIPKRNLGDFIIVFYREQGKDVEDQIHLLVSELN